MQDLSFFGIQGRHSVYSRYVFEKLDGVTCLCPADSTAPVTYDPVKNPDVLLLYVLAVADIIISCADFWGYCAERGGSRISETIFWAGDDYFASESRDSRRIKQILMSFAGKYGVPEWETTRFLEAELPDRYAHLLSKRETDISVTDENRCLAAKIDARSREIIPVGAMALMMVGYYDRFLSQKGETHLKLDRADMSFRHEKDGAPELSIRVNGLNSCVDMAYIIAVCGKKSALRRCKHCGKHFIAADPRSEYCSKRCRSAFNSAVTRKRKKDDMDE